MAVVAGGTVLYDALEAGGTVIMWWERSCDEMFRVLETFIFVVVARTASVAAFVA